SDPLSADEVRGSVPLSVSQRVPVAVAGGAAVVGIAGFLATGMALLLVLLAVVPLALGWAAFRLGRAQKRLPMVLPLDRSARAVVDAYRELGEMSEAAAGSLTIEPRASGYLRCVLSEASAEESARFADVLDGAVDV